MVYFVGAGCGAADLITVRGMKLLESADVIIYAGSLVNPELLQYAKEGCAVHNSALMTLDEVISIIKQADSDNKTVVRLHTGEPSVYGAIRARKLVTLMVRLAQTPQMRRMVSLWRRAMLPL